MSDSTFIHPSTLRQRILGHLSFWIFFTLHFFIQNLIVGTTNEALHQRTPLEAFINTAYFLPIYILSAYVFDTFVVRQMLFRHRYGAFATATGGLLAFNFVACYYAGVLYEHNEWKIPYSQITFVANKYHALVNGGFVSVMILGIAGGLRFARQWWQKQRENEAIRHQKIASELQLLKIQINPRFLFHALHTVKQNIVADSTRSPQLILQVADLLSYILYESDRDFISLKKELSIVEDYLSLEESCPNVREPLQFEISGEVNDKEVIPLMLLSVVETAFEYLLESKIDFAVKIKTVVAAEELRLTLFARGNFEIMGTTEDKFSGLKKQLDGVYGNAYQLRIETDSKQAAIDFQLPLRIVDSASNKQKDSPFVYE